MCCKVLNGLRGMTLAHQEEYKARIEALLDDSDIPCDWVNLDISSLGCAADDAKLASPPPPSVDEDDLKVFYSVEDYVVTFADQAVTEKQRFWIAKVMNVATHVTLPNIEQPDPVSVPNATEYLKVWWYEATAEFTKYKAGWHRNDSGQRVRSLSWIRADSVIQKLARGLNQNGTIKAYKKYRRALEYDIKDALGHLDGPEDLEYEPLTDDTTSEKAQSMLMLVVRQIRDGEDDAEARAVFGTVDSIVLPEEGERDQRIRFLVKYDNDDQEMVVLEVLEQLVAQGNE